MSNQKAKIEFITKACRMIQTTLGPQSAFEVQRQRLLEAAARMLAVIDAKAPDPEEAMAAAREFTPAGAAFVKSLSQLRDLAAFMSKKPSN